MPPQLGSPGVYIVEVPSQVRTITGVATSITAFVGRARKGPADEPVKISNFGEFQRHFGGLWEWSPMSYAVRDFFLNGGGAAAIVRVHNNATSALFSLPSGTGNPLLLEAVSPGSWGDNLTFKIDHKTKDLSDTTLFNITIIEKDPITKENLTVERFFNVSYKNDASSIAKTLAQSSALVRVKNDQSSTTTNLTLTDRTQILDTTLATPTGATVTRTTGGDGNHILDAQIHSGANMQTDKKGLYALEKTDLFNLLCIPPFAGPSATALTVTEKATDVTTASIAAAVSYCKQRRAVLLIDSHSTWNTKGKVDTGFSSYPGVSSDKDYAAMFFPRLIQTNPQTGNFLEEFVPCGAVAGIIARTDAQRGVWKSPAGIEAGLAGVDALTVPLTDSENGDLNQIGINCLRTFPIYRRVVWGSRTLDGADVTASQWKYLPVRRTALFIEESLFRGLKWVVFEPNDEPLWAQIRLNVGAFMHNLFRQGAFQGTTPKEAYFVKCDKETTTQNDINLGIVNIVVGFAPLKPAEFVVLYLQQMAGQVEA